MANFIDIDVELDPEEMKAQVYEALQLQWPDWEPAEGNLETLLVEAFTNQTVDLTLLAAEVPADVFKAFGESILGIPPLASAPATTTSTWTTVDNAGYTIPAGTALALKRSGNESVAFATTEDVIVAPGATTAGLVTLEAIEPGAVGNGLDGDVSMIDALDYVVSVELEGATANGADEETDEAYLDRLAEEMQLLSPRPIIPDDFEVQAKRIPGVWRALALDLYNPDDDTWDNPRMVTLAMVDEAGEAVSAGIKDAVEARLESMREINFIVNTMDPNYTEVDVETEVVYRTGFDPAAVEANVESRIASYLSPATYGNERDFPRQWLQRTHLRFNDLLAHIDTVPGVDYVQTLGIRIHGVGSYGTTDLALLAPATLTRAGDIAATAVTE